MKKFFYLFCLSVFPLLFPIRGAISQEGFMSPSGVIVTKSPSTHTGYPQVTASPLIDPDQGSVLLFPAARTLPRGKVAFGIVRSIGIGLDVGITDCFTLGAGFSPSASFQIEAKWAILKGLNHTLSFWGLAHLPFTMHVYRDDYQSTTEDWGFMISGGILYAFQGERFDLKMGLLYHDFVMLDKFKKCRGSDCKENYNLWHKWIIFSPYLETGYRVSLHFKIFALLSTFDISITKMKWENIQGEAHSKESQNFFWKDIFIVAGIRYFRHHMAIDLGLLAPIIPEKWKESDDFPYILPVIGTTFIF